MSAFDAEGVDGAESFGDAQAVDREQGDQGVLVGCASPAATSSEPTSLRSRPIACDS